MRAAGLSSLVVVLLVLAVAPHGAQGEGEDNGFKDFKNTDVLVLNYQSFEETIRKYKNVVVAFWAPWCGHSKNLGPHFIKAATILKDDIVPITLASVDITIQKELANDYKVRTYPTLLMFKNGKVYDPIQYGGQRELEGILKYLRKEYYAVVVELVLEKHADIFMNNTEHGVVAFIDKDKSLLKTFKQVGTDHKDDYRFAFTKNKDVMAKYGHTDQVVVYQPEKLLNVFEPKEFVYNGKNDAQELFQFVEDSVLGKVPFMTSKNEKLIMARKPVVLVYLDYTSMAAQIKYIRNRIGKYVVEQEPDAFFAITNKADYRREMEYFDVKGDLAITLWDEQGKRFRAPEGNFTVEGLESFVDGVLGGKIEPFMKSEPIPDNTNAVVKKIVAKTFNSIVMQPNRDVFIKFQSPWCNHCQAMDPAWTELAEKLQTKDPHIIIADMDATLNTIPEGLHMGGYPSLYYFPDYDKTSPVKYDGTRDVKDLMKFIKQHRSTARKDEL